MGFFDTTVGEVASPIASLITGATNVYMQNKTNQLTRELAQQQNLWNIDQWNRENEYNLPSNQMQRFVDAGLNPNLIYGKDSVAATSPQMVSGYDSQVAPKMQFDPSTLLMASEARKNDAIANKMNSEADTEVVRQSYLKVKTDEISQNVENLKTINENLKKEGKQLDYENEYLGQTLVNRIAQVDVDLDMSRKERDAFDRITAATLEKIYAETDESRSRIKLNEAEASASRALVGYYNALKNKSDVETEYQKMYNALYQIYGNDLMVSQIINRVYTVAGSSDFVSAAFGPVKGSRSKTRYEIVRKDGGDFELKAVKVKDENWNPLSKIYRSKSDPFGSW